MFDYDSPYVRYWAAEADDAHRWRRVIMQAGMRQTRRSRECGLMVDIAADRELRRAEQVFEVRYHYAFAQRTAALVGMSLEQALAA